MTDLQFVGTDLQLALETWTNLDPQQRQSLYPDLLKAATQAPDASTGIRLRELALEVDPTDANNLVHLLLLGLGSQDELRVYLYAQALLEVWETLSQPEDPWGIRANSFFKVLLGQLSLGGYWEIVFELGLAYLPALPPEQRDPTVAVLAPLAQYYAPDWLEAYPLTWQPADLLHWIVPEILKLLLEGSSLKGYSIIAAHMQALAITPEVAGQPELELRLLADALDYCCLSGLPQQAQTLLDKILTRWPLQRIQALAAHPEPGSLVLLWTILFRVCFDMAYLTDDQPMIRAFQQTAAAGFSHWLQAKYPQLNLASSHQFPNLDQPERPLRVGYLGLCFRRHSVGSLSLQALTRQDPQRVQTYYYFTGTLDEGEDPIFQAFKAHSHQFYELGQREWHQVLAQVQADDLDILVHLDATTSDVGCKVLAFRPAPIQVSWLGGDSPGIPEIDYFWVDPHILAADAQADYTETLWRLPTFAAVESFAVADLDLDLFRQRLGIPEGWMVYWTAAHARKRSDVCIDAHLQILHAVNESVLMIKGVGDITTVVQAYQQRAAALGILDRLRFLPMTRFNEQHRAQLQLADVILDTFPYTGATHTIEALYLGIPVLTQVGRHYYGRMSYSLLENVGLRACITWDPQEYVEQGIRLGQDRELLNQVKATLRESREDPACVVWDPQGLARALEASYFEFVANAQAGE